MQKTIYLFITIVLLLFSNFHYSQDVVSPNQVSEISFDYKTKKILGVFPFDEDFKIAIKNIKTTEIQTAILYEIEYKHNRRTIKNYKQKIDSILFFNLRNLKKFKEVNEESFKNGVFKTIKEETFKDTVFKLMFSKKIIINGNDNYLIDSIITRNSKQIKNFKATNKKSIKLGLLRISSEKSFESTIFKLVYKKNVAVYNRLSFQPTLESKTTSTTFVKPLEPEKLYEIALIKNNSMSNILVYHSFLNEYIKLIKDGNLDKKDSIQLKKLFKSKIIPLKNNTADREILISSISNEFKFFLNKINNITSFVQQVEIPKADNIISYNNISKDLSHIGNVFYQKKIDITLFSSTLSVFFNNDSLAIKDFSEGKVKQKVKGFDYETRLTNLKNNSLSLKKIKSDIDKLRISMNDSIINQFYDKFITKAIKTLESNIKNINIYHSKIKNLINQTLPEILLISGATQSNDLKTANSNALIADIGLVNGMAFNSDGETKYLFRPVLGLNWHIRGINKNQPLNQINNRKFRHFCSLYLGLTIGGINTDDYEDLYNSISPILGINCRLTRQIRVGVGSIFLREKNINPILDKNKVVMAPYLSMSFDVGLFGEAQKLISKIGF